MKKFFAAGLFFLLMGCSGNDLASQVAYTATAVDGVAKAALVAYNSGLIKPNSDPDKALTAALHTAGAAVNNANAALKSGNTQAVTYYTGIAAAAAAQATTEVNKYLPNTAVAAQANTPVPTASQ